jgi:hypothetical protein
VTNREGFVLASKSLEGNPYDGHTLDNTIGQVIAMTDVEPARIYVDQGYRGHDYAKTDRVFITRQRRGLTPTIRRELRRRSAIEPMIGHMKADGRLGRNYLLGAARRHERAAGGRRAQSTADPELALVFCRLVPGSSDGFIRAIGYCPRTIEANRRLIKRHCSGPTTLALNQEHILR